MSNDPYVHPAHSYLDDRGIPADYAERAGIRPLKFMETLGQFGVKSDALLIPYPPVNGETLDFARVRLFDPSATPDARKFTQKSKTGVHLYLPPFTKGSKRTWDKVKADPRVRITITEGEIKAACAVVNGVACIGIGGVTCWQSGGKAIKDWDHFEWQERQTDLVFDTDVMWKSDVKRALCALADELTGRGAKVRIRFLYDVTGKGKTGLDDYLVAKGAERYESEVPAYGYDSDYVRQWRGEQNESVALDFPQTDVAWFTERLPEMEHTVLGLLPAGVVGLLSAEGGTGKTFVALDLAFAVATGLPFVGRPTRKGVVVYIGFEDSASILRRRVERIYSQYAAAYPKDAKRILADLKRNLRIKSLVGEQHHVVTAQYGAVIQNTAVVDHFAQSLAGIDGLELVIMDPLARLHGGNENDNAVATSIVNALEAVRLRANCTMLITHHTGKGSSTGRRKGMYAARGASAFADAARIGWHLFIAEKDDVKDHKLDAADVLQRRILILEHTKTNYARHEPDTWIRRGDHGELRLFEPEYTGSVAALYDTMLASLRTWMTKQGGAPVAPRTLRALRQTVFGDGISQTQVTQFLAAACHKRDVIETKGKTRGTAYTVTTAGGSDDE